MQYVMSIMIAVPSDSTIIFLCESASHRSIDAYRVAGMMREVVPTAIRDDMLKATVSLNLLSARLTPDVMKQEPRANRIFRMDPIMLDCTILTSPRFSAVILT
jgi:hypothetical protein